MGRLVRFPAPGQAEVVDFDERAPAAGEVLLETVYSGISAGTELTLYRSHLHPGGARYEPLARRALG